MGRMEKMLDDAESGNECQMVNLANAYIDGSDGFARDPEKAWFWMDRVAHTSDFSVMSYAFKFLESQMFYAEQGCNDSPLGPNPEIMLQMTSKMMGICSTCDSQDATQHANLIRRIALLWMRWFVFAAEGNQATHSFESIMDCYSVVLNMQSDECRAGALVNHIVASEGSIIAEIDCLRRKHSSVNEGGGLYDKYSSAAHYLIGEVFRKGIRCERNYESSIKAYVKSFDRLRSRDAWDQDQDRKAWRAMGDMLSKGGFGVVQDELAASRCYSMSR